MEIFKFNGEDQRLYYLVAHLVMNEEVLRYNCNYPYRTSDAYKWFVAIDDNGSTLGFIPVKIKDGKAVINNYYVADDDAAVFASLLKEIIQDLLPDFEIESSTQMQHVPFFEKSGFSTLFNWKRYARMKAFRNEEKCL